MSEKDPRRREIFMNIPAVRPPTEQSFEEWRIEDYIRAYTTTGQPPQPSPIQPTNKAERVRAGLPPLFEPYVEIGGSPASLEHSAAAAISLVTSGSPSPPPRDPAAIPDVQIFEPTPDTSESGNKVQLQSIVCNHVYAGFSPEELRCKAYTMGKVFVPEAISGSSTDPVSPTDKDQLQSITATAAYSGHSFEELRLAYLRAGRELSSAHISQLRVFG